MFNIYKFKKALSFLPFPIFRVMQRLWRGLRHQLTFFYFKVMYPNTELLLGNKLGGGQFGQSSIIDALLNQKKNGYFIDVGANHPIVNSNSAFFEIERGFTGIAFDPLGSYVKDWGRARPHTKFIQAAIGDSRDRIYFYKVIKRNGWEDQLSYVEKNYYKPQSGCPEPEIVEVFALKDLNLPSVDFASIDVEGHELNVLKGMLPDVKPKVLLIENCGFPFGSEKIRKIAISNGYVLHARIGYVDDLYILPGNC